MRNEWFTSAKPFGFEVIQIRNSGQSARLLECARRLTDYANGNISSIPELDASIGDAALGYAILDYRNYASGSVIK